MSSHCESIFSKPHSQQWYQGLLSWAEQKNWAEGISVENIPSQQWKSNTETEQGTVRDGRCNRALKCRRSGSAGRCLGTYDTVWTRYILITCCCWCTAGFSVCLGLFVRRCTASQMTLSSVFKVFHTIIQILSWFVFQRNWVADILLKWSDTHTSLCAFSVFLSLSYGTYSHSLGTWHVCPCGCGWYGERCEDWQRAQHGFGLDFK